MAGEEKYVANGALLQKCVKPKGTVKRRIPDF